MISSTTARKDYVASASQTEFEYTFRIFNDSDLLVFVNGLLQGLNSEYTVTGAGNEAGGTVEFTSGLESGDKVAILSAIPATQLTDYTPGGKFPATSHEAALDKITRLVQQLDEQQDRQPTVDAHHPPGDLSLALPDPGAGKLFGWHEDGDRIALFDAQLAEPVTSDVDMGGNDITNLGTQGVSLLTGSANPSVSPGVAAPVGTLYLRNNGETTGTLETIRGQLWLKKNTGNTAWVMVAPHVVTPDDFGAVPDGATDCTAAFQAADESFRSGTNSDLGFGVIFVPPSSGSTKASGSTTVRSYRVNGNLTLTRSNLIGFKSVITLGSAANTILFQPDGSPPFDEFEAECNNMVFRPALGVTRDPNVPLLEIDNGGTVYQLTHCLFAGTNPGPFVKLTAGRHCSVVGNDFLLGEGGRGVEVDAPHTRIAWNSFRKSGAAIDVKAIVVTSNGAGSKIGINTYENVTARIDNASNVRILVTPDTYLLQETWDPGPIANADFGITQFTVPSGVASFGSAFVVSSTPELTNGMFLTAKVDEDNSDVIHVQLFNLSGSSRDEGELTLNIVVFAPQGFVVS